MADVDSRLEVERIENLIINFGWKVVKQEFKDTEIVLKISKPIFVPAVEIDAGAS